MENLIKKFNGRISITTLLLVMCSIKMVQAQATYDSSFHNYLYDSRTAYFRQLPAVKKATVFLGDSITQWGDWAEFFGFSKVLNRGIAGDNTYGILARLEEVARHRPKKLFILAGTNDLNLNGAAAIAIVVENIKRMVLEIRRISPHTKLYIQSVFPINNKLINEKYYKGKNEQIREMNLRLQEMCSGMGVEFVNVYSSLLDETQQLDARYTYDGLHLSAAGYLAWVNHLKMKNLL